MIKTFLVYLIANILLVPYYMYLFFTLVFAMGTQTGKDVGLLMIGYFIGMLPNILIGLLLWFARNRFKFNPKINLICFLLSSIWVFYFLFVKLYFL